MNLRFLCILSGLVTAFTSYPQAPTRSSDVLAVPWMPSDSRPDRLFRFGDVVWASGSRYVWRSADVGKNWEQIAVRPLRDRFDAGPVHSGVALSSFGATGPMEAWAWIGPIAYVTADGGRTWTQRLDASDSFTEWFTPNRMACVANCTIAWILENWDAGSNMLTDYGVARYRNGKALGRTSLARVQRFRRVDFAFRADGVGFGWFDQKFFRTPDGGLTWSRILDGCDNEGCDVMRVWFYGKSTVWLLRHNGLLFRSKTSGATWTRVTASPLWDKDRTFDPPPNGFFSDGRSVKVIGKDVRIHESEDGGVNWRTLTIQGDPAIRDFACVSARDCIYLGDGVLGRLN